MSSMGLDFEVTELGSADHVDVGEKAPEFTRPLVNEEYWEDVSLSELLENGPVVLVFHAMDGDFPATYTWQEIRDRGWDEWEAEVVGVSVSTPYEHEEFLREWRGFERFSLFSDPQNDVAEAYGVVHDLDGMSGVSEARPAVFVVDTDRTVQYAWAATEYPDFPRYETVEAAVESL